MKFSDTSSRKTDSSAASMYFSDLQNRPHLKHAELMTLFQQYEIAEGPERMKLRNKIAEVNLRLVVSIAKQYKNHNVALEELVQEGNIGLLKAIERFDWKRGFRFSTYATWWIKQSITQYTLNNKRMVRMPAHAVAIQKRLIAATEEYREEFGHDPTIEELIGLLDASETVIRATMHSCRGIVSMQSESTSVEQDVNASAQEQMSDVDPFDITSQRETLALIKTILDDLEPKESAIIRLRFGLVEDPQDDQKYPITEEEIEQIRLGRGIK